MPRLRLFALGVLCSVTVPLIGRAQEPRRLMTSDSIPTELAAALIASGGLGGDPQILVGSFPGWVANRIYVPANARVLGAAFIGQTAVGVMSVPDAPEAILAELNRELPSRGWKAPPPRGAYGGGFRPASMATPTGSPTTIVLCADQQMLSVSASRHRGTTTLVTVRVTPASQYSACTPPPMPSGMTRSPLPTLFNPVSLNDTRVTSSCSGDLEMSSGTVTSLRTAMTSDAILSHYAKQLSDSGWRVENNRGSIIGRSWTRTDSAGAPVQVSLTVAESLRDSTCRDVNMQVRTLRKP